MRALYLGVFFQSLTRSTGFSDSRDVNLGRSDRDDRLFDGELAEWGIWDKVISDDDFLALNKGFRPIHIQPSNLIGYFPLVRDVINVVGALPTVTGTTIAEHPRMIG